MGLRAAIQKSPARFQQRTCNVNVVVGEQSQRGEQASEDRLCRANAELGKLSQEANILDLGFQVVLASVRSCLDGEKN